MSIEQRLFDFLNTYWTHNSVTHPEHLKEAVNIYNEYYHDNHQEHGLPKRNRIKESCASCGTLPTLLNGLKNLVSKKLLQSAITDGQTYLDRIDTCRKCEYFNATTTQCNECGCFLHLKAPLKKQDCPHPDGSKWSKL